MEGDVGNLTEVVLLWGIFDNVVGEFMKNNMCSQYTWRVPWAIA
jgi:hypothetical protein